MPDRETLDTYSIHWAQEPLTFLYCTNCQSTSCEHVTLTDRPLYVTSITEAQRRAFALGIYFNLERFAGSELVDAAAGDVGEALHAEREEQSPRFCKDCVHYRRVGNEHYCNDPRGTKVDLVTGEEKPVKSSFSYCYDERDNASADDFARYGYEKCGSEGLHFVQCEVEPATVPEDILNTAWNDISAFEARNARLIGRDVDGVPAYGAAFSRPPLRHEIDTATDRCRHCDAATVEIADGNVSPYCPARS